jgi:diguanylate cyclase (GGDEF)-like protein
MREPDRAASWLGAPGPLPPDGLNPQLVEVCMAVVDEMTAAGIELSSVYLQAGTTLRCYAIEGYRQLFDGIGSGVGVIGSVWSSGECVEATGVGSSPSYRAAVPGVVAETCVPIALDGECVGVINAESVRPLPPGTRALLESLADRLSERLAVLGPPRSSLAQVLLTQATQLAESHEAPAIADRFLEAATSTAGLSSAVLLLGRPPRGVAACGPLGDAIAALSFEELVEIDAWVAHGGSSRTAPSRDGLVLHGQQALHDLGARSLVLVSLGRGSDRLGSLLLADERDIAVTLATAEALELLGELAAANLRSARAMGRLRRAATTDTLTGLGHRAAFDSALEEALSAPEGGVALLMLDLDGFKAVNDNRGHSAGDELLRNAATALSRALRQGDQLFRVGGDEFATVLRVRDAAEAEAIGERLVSAYRSSGMGSVSVGIAMAAADESLADLVARADNALYATKRGGRDGLTLA